MWCVGVGAGGLGCGGLRGSLGVLSQDQARGSSVQPAAPPACRPCSLPNAPPRAPLALWLAWRGWGLLTGGGGRAPGPGSTPAPHSALWPTGQVSRRAAQPNGAGIDFPALGGGWGGCNRKLPSLAAIFSIQNTGGRKRSSRLSPAGSVRTPGSLRPSPVLKLLARLRGPRPSSTVSSTS